MNAFTLEQLRDRLYLRKVRAIQEQHPNATADYAAHLARQDGDVQLAKEIEARIA